MKGGGPTFQTTILEVERSSPMKVFVQDKG